MSAVFTLDPLQDPRWDRFVERHPDASIFHTRGWLEALQGAYGFQSVVYTTSAPGSALANGIVMCRVNSWLTGRRLVSVPFADHAAPLLDSSVAAHDLGAFLGSVQAADGLRYVELRPVLATSLTGFGPSRRFAFHLLDLRPGATQLFGRLHKDAMQRKIRRAAREGIRHQQGRSDEMLAAFHRLLAVTRRRHGLPAQPFDWFRNLRSALGDRLTVHLALKDDEPVGGIITLSHRQTTYYKYGASDARHHASGVMPFLLWTAVEHACGRGYEQFDLGRSDLGNPGLRTFKDRLGAAQTVLTYVRWPAPAPESHDASSATGGLVRRFVPLLPVPVLNAAGRLLYRHLA